MAAAKWRAFENAPVVSSTQREYLGREPEAQLDSTTPEEKSDETVNSICYRIDFSFNPSGCAANLIWRGGTVLCSCAGAVSSSHRCANESNHASNDPANGELPGHTQRPAPPRRVNDPHLARKRSPASQRHRPVAAHQHHDPDSRYGDAAGSRLL